MEYKVMKKEFSENDIIYLVLPPHYTSDLQFAFMSRYENVANIKCAEYNEGIAPLHAEIARLKAENAKLKALATTVWQVSVESFLDWKHNEYESLGRYLGLMSVGLGEINPEMRTSKLQSKHEARQSAIAELEALKEKKEESEADNA